MLTFIIIVLLIAILILVHEWGHFYAAIKLGVRVEEFSIGFGKKLFSRVHNGVRYSIRLLPLGGFVRMYGEQGEHADEPDSFGAKPAWRRFIILAAGVGMNIVAAWVFFSGSAAIGIPTIADDTTAAPVSIIAVTPDTPAMEADLRFGDQVLEIHSKNTSIVVNIEEDVINFVNAHQGEKLTLLLQRGNTEATITVTPRTEYPEDQGPLGISLARFEIVRAPLYLAPIEGTRSLWRTIVATFEGFGSILSELFATGRPPTEVSGPIGIFFFASDIFQLGISYMLQFAGIISVNLAILNFLPIPILDGGWVLFLIIEKLRGNKLNNRVQNALLATGFAFLGLLMIFVTYQDITRNSERILDGIKSVVPF